jgi:O-antigen ligase
MTARRDLAVAILLGLAIFAAAALGVPSDEMLQDTFKSAVVAFGALVAALVSVWPRSEPACRLRWHPALGFPVLLMAYALASVVWSHPYLASVEAIRWFVFALLMGLALNSFDRAHLPLLAWAVAAGAAIASIWTVLQFFFAFDLFPQGVRPGSTFANRNFFAEYAACALPFAVILLVRARSAWVETLSAVMTGFIALAICMTGTRAALVALALQVFVLFPLAVWRWRLGPMRAWPFAVVVAILAALGSIPTGDKGIAGEQRGLTALERATSRAASIAPGDVSLTVRQSMWRSTTRMIAAHPLAGVGAGAWENEVPLFQQPGSRVETDFHAHNEFLQLVAEYGLVGWIVLAAFITWACAIAMRTWRAQDAEEGAWRAALLSSIAALLVVATVGFPVRLAPTGALLALCVGALIALDGRSRQVALPPAASLVAAAAGIAAVGIAAHVTWLAASAESRLARATRIALSIDASPDPHDPRWLPYKAEMLRDLAEGIRVNPHYRKLTPIAADAMARWGDWKDAIWVWESVLASRPNIAAIQLNVARGYLALGQPDRAQPYLERARRIEEAQMSASKG